jgi:hypothetical protein
LVTNAVLEPGRYRMKSTTDGFAYQASPGKNASDVAVEAEMQRISGPTNVLYGIYLRNSPDLGYYVFRIDDEGRFVLARWVRTLGGFDAMARGTAKVNAGGKNTLRLTAKGKALRMEVNGEVLGEVQETKTFSTFGSYGLDTSSGIEVAVTRFVASVP